MVPSANVELSAYALERRPSASSVRSSSAPRRDDDASLLLPLALLRGAALRPRAGVFTAAAVGSDPSSSPPTSAPVASLTRLRFIPFRLRALSRLASALPFAAGDGAGSGLVEVMAVVVVEMVAVVAPLGGGVLSGREAPVLVGVVGAATTPSPVGLGGAAFGGMSESVGEAVSRRERPVPPRFTQSH